MYAPSGPVWLYCKGLADFGAIRHFSRRVRDFTHRRKRHMPLTPKQESFVEEYLNALNATQAAITAGYSKKTAHVIGPENLGKPAIAAAVSRAQGDRTERTKIT